MSIKGNRFYTIASLNREKNSSIKVNVECHLKSTKSPLSQFSTKLFNFTVMDVNDNAIKVQSNHKVINVTLDSPYFQKVGGRTILMKNH